MRSPLCILASGIWGCGMGGMPAGSREAIEPAAYTREADLAVSFDRDILPYYTAHGEAGSFSGVKGSTIRYLKFGVSNEKGALIIWNGRTESYIKYAELIYDFRSLGY